MKQNGAIWSVFQPFNLTFTTCRISGKLEQNFTTNTFVDGEMQQNACLVNAYIQQVDSVNVSDDDVKCWPVCNQMHQLTWRCRAFYCAWTRYVSHSFHRIFNLPNLYQLLLWHNLRKMTIVLSLRLKWSSLGRNFEPVLGKKSGPVTFCMTEMRQASIKQTC